MSDVTLKVPAAYVKPIRAAAVAELGSDAQWVSQMQEELSRHLLEAEEAAQGPNLTDVRGSARCLAAVVDVLGPLFDAPDGDLEIRSDAETVMHLCATMAEEVIAPQISHEVITQPFGDEGGTKIRALTEALGWAVDESVRAGHHLTSAKSAATEVAR